MAEEPARSPGALIAHAAENGRGIALIAAETKALAAMIEAVRSAAEASDYCVVCDCHPSSGHAEGCVVA